MTARARAGALLLAAVALAGLVTTARAGWPPVAVVESDSMLPAFASGDLLVLGPAGAVAEGDVVVVPVPERLRAERGYPARLAHRVVEVRAGTVRTQGDRFGEPDPFTVPVEAVTQRAVAVVPLAGHALAFLGSPVGMLWVVGGLLLAARLREADDGKDAPATAADLAALRAEIARAGGVGAPPPALPSLSAPRLGAVRPDPPGWAAAMAAVRAGDSALGWLDQAAQAPPRAGDDAAGNSA